MFLDQVTLTLVAGDGGDGAATFRREAHVPRGGPDGGDGGRGGSVHLVVDVGQTMLADYRFKHHFRAPAGGRGEGSRRHGKAGRDLELHVPPGTVVLDARSGELLADLIVPGQLFLAARGGRGGLGNTHFATATHQAPRHAQKGEPGEERRLRLELRLIADVGLVGLPNAGKSTLLAALTAATPKIGDYPFTTLEPNLGVIVLDEDGVDERRPTIADLPGLIEGASEGAGLGHAFLRHVERTRVLVHVVDVSAPDPERDFAVIREELRARDPRLLEKTQLVVANKIDLLAPAPAAAGDRFALAREAEGLEVVRVSASRGDGLAEVRASLARLLPDAAALGRPAEPAGVVVHRFEPDETAFSVGRDAEGRLEVRGRRIERLAAQTDFANPESAARFQRELARRGVEAELLRAGVAPGDTVRIGAIELEWDAEPGAWA